MPLTSLPQTVRAMQRLQRIATVLTRHGFGHMVDRLSLRRYVPFRRRLRPSAPTRTVGQRLVRVCEDLGPTFIKLGQMASTRPDLLPPDLIADLRRLQDHVAPFDGAQAKARVAEALGRPIEECFTTFDEQPIASGSIAQVHTATAPDPQRVGGDMPLVVKVRRPGIEQTIASDIHILRGLADTIERYVPELRVYRPRVIVDEFDRSIRQELDFIHEASATASFDELFGSDPQVVSPSVRWDLTTSSVMTMQRIDGRPLAEALAAGTVNRPVLARTLAMAFFRQYFRAGIFHADPHPGNLQVLGEQRLGLLDFGIVGRVDDELADQMAVILVATVKKRVDIIVDALADLGTLDRDTDIRQLRRDLTDLLEKYYGLPLKHLELQAIFSEVTAITRQNRVQLPRDFVLLAKSMVTVTGVALQLDPQINLLELLGPQVRQLALERLSVRRLVAGAGVGAWHLLNVVRSAPRTLRDVFRHLRQGHLQVTIRHQNLDHLASELDRASNRLSFSVIMASIFLGSSMLVTSSSTVAWFGVRIQTFGFVGYLVAAIMGLWLLLAILRSGKLS